MVDGIRRQPAGDDRTRVAPAIALAQLPIRQWPHRSAPGRRAAACVIWRPGWASFPKERRFPTADVPAREAPIFSDLEARPARVQFLRRLETAAPWGRRKCRLPRQARRVIRSETSRTKLMNESLPTDQQLAALTIDISREPLPTDAG